MSRIAIVFCSLSFIFLIWSYGIPHYSASSRYPGPGEKVVDPEEYTPGQFFARTTTTTESSFGAATGIPKPRPETSGEEDPEILEPTPTPVVIPPAVPSTKSCLTAKGADDIMVVLKTSATEIYDKLPEHLLTLFQCTPHYAIFSDLDGVVAGHKVYDALENITAETRAKNKEFQYYDKIQEYGAEGQQLADLKGEGTKNLDKWKFLPMVYRAYRMQPYAKFFVFIEADTSLSWTNLLQWTTRLDSRIPIYAGAPSNIGSIRFAQRGGGLLISNAAAKLYATAYDQKYVGKWENRTATECCGDVMVAIALAEAHVEFYSAFPLLQGETPATLDWTKRHWCAPVVSWHHMSPNEIDILWNFQQAWTKKNGWQTPYLIKNAFSEFVSPRLSPSRSNWDNLSQDHKITRPADDEALGEGTAWYKLSDADKNSTLSFDYCKATCASYADCLQWRYKTGECALSKVIKLGRRVTGENAESKSGWFVERIEKLTRSWEPCEEPSWSFNQ